MARITGCIGPVAPSDADRSSSRRRLRDMGRAEHAARCARLRTVHADFLARLEARVAAGADAPTLAELVDLGLPRQVADGIVAFCVSADLDRAHWDGMARYVVRYFFHAPRMQWDHDVLQCWVLEGAPAREALYAALEQEG